MNQSSSATFQRSEEIEGKRDPNLRPNAFDYSSSEECLRDFCTHLKHTRALTLKALALKSGLSLSLISMFVSGQRHLSPKASLTLKEALPLEQPEKDYIELLVVSESSDSGEEVLSALRKLRGTKEFQKHMADEAAIFEYLSLPLNVVIREMVHLTGFKDEPKWIQSTLNNMVSLTDIKKSLSFLENSGFLKRNEDDQLEVAEKDISCMDKIMRLSMIDYHKSMFSQIIDSLDKRDVQRDVSGQTVSIHSERFDEVVEMLKDVRQKLRVIEKESLESNQADMVLHVGLGALPLATIKKEDEE